MNNYDIKSIINDGLKKKSMTQSALAAALGIERATVNRWCVGRAIPEANTFLDVCKLLDIHVDLYLYDSEDPLDQQLFSLSAQLNDKQKLALLRILKQVSEIVKEDTIPG